MAKELRNSLTVREREMLYEEVHGMSNITEETPEFVQNSLENLRNKIKLLPRRSRKALDRAIFLRPDIMTDDTLYLFFLRGARFDAATAASLMAQHFESKLVLFGDIKLPKITLDHALGDYNMTCAPCTQGVSNSTVQRSGRSSRPLFHCYSA